ncbi:MAG: hypothetical protein M0Z80_06635 [Treponema sp.]|nr:hypothetical protein [Treponema sp.]
MSIAALLAIAGVVLSCGPAHEERRVLAAFYDANDAGRFDLSLSMVSENVAFDSWAQAINGNHLGTRHLEGKEALRPYLGKRGLCRNFYGPDGPFYLLRSIRASGSKVSFELIPDRTTPSGRPYNIYRGEFTFEGGLIRAITMVEVIGWL